MLKIKGSIGFMMVFVLVCTLFQGITFANYSGNLLSNPGFETGVEDGWSKRGGSALEYVATTDLGYVKSGTTSLKLNKTTGTGFLSWGARQDPNFTNGTYYLLGAWVKAEANTSPNFRIFTNLSTIQLTTTASSEWKYVAKVVNNLSGTVSAVFGFHDDDVGTVYVDDIYVGPVATAVDEALAQATSSKSYEDILTVKTMLDAWPTADTNRASRLSSYQTLVNDIASEEKVSYAENNKTQQNIDLAQRVVSLVTDATKKANYQSRVLVAQAGYNKNLLTNPNIEDAFVPVANQLVGWDVRSSGTRGIYYDDSPNNIRNGSGVARVLVGPSTISSWGTVGAQSTAFQMDSSKSYIASTWIKQNTGTSRNFRITLRRSNGTLTHSSNTSVSSGVWTQVKWLLTTSPATDSYQMIVGLDTDYNNTFYMDDVFIGEVAPFDVNMSSSAGNTLYVEGSSATSTLSSNLLNQVGTTDGVSGIIPSSIVYTIESAPTGVTIDGTILTAASSTLSGVVRVKATATYNVGNGDETAVGYRDITIVDMDDIFAPIEGSGVNQTQINNVLSYIYNMPSGNAKTASLTRLDNAQIVFDGNMIRNSGFEFGTNDWFRRSSGAGNGISEYTTDKYYGSKSLNVIAGALTATSGVNGAITAENILLEQNKTYVITAWVKGISNINGRTPRALLRTSTPALIYPGVVNSNNKFDETGIWKQVQFTYTHNSANIYAALCIGIADADATENRTFLLDNVFMSELSGDSVISPYVTEQGGLDITDSALGVGDVTVKTTITNVASESNVATTAIIALYDSNNNLVSIAPIQDKSLVKGVAQDVELTINVPSESNYIKVFMWDGINTMKPLNKTYIHQ